MRVSDFSSHMSARTETLFFPRVHRHFWKCRSASILSRNTWRVKAIIEKPNPEAPMGAIDTAKLVKGIKEFLSGLWSNLVRIFGNIWESKPLNDGAQNPESGHIEGIEETDPLHMQDSLDFHTGSVKDDFSSLPEDDFDKNIDSLSEDHIKPFEDKAIKDALMSGDVIFR